MDNHDNVAVAPDEPVATQLHLDEDTLAAWRVWHDRREALVQYMQRSYSWLDPQVVRNMVLGVELGATCMDSVFERFYLGDGVAQEVMQ